MQSLKIFFYILATLFIISCGKTDVPEAGLKHPEWSQNNTIYELNIRQFSGSGTFNAITPRLVAIRDLGVKTIWLMPIHPIGEKNRKGNLGSPYSVKDYRAVNPEYGTIEDFKVLVNRIHEMGMYVIIDWVANHTSWDNDLIHKHPDWYSQDSTGTIISPNPDWTDVADLNYENRQVWDYMIESMKFWVQETGIDGFRCDVAEMVPLEFWQEARTELDKVKPVFMLAEGAKPELHSAFDATYSWNLFHLMNEIAAGKRTANSIDTLLRAERDSYPASAMRMRFTSNHDENSWNGTVFERLGEGAKTFAVLSATLPGIPLLYSGQEAGMDKRLSFFDKDPIEWRVNYFRRFYSRLFRLHQTNSALYAGSMEIIPTEANKTVFAFVRENEKQKIVTVLNFSADTQQIVLKTSGVADTYREHFTSRKTELHRREHMTLEPWDFKVFVKIQN